MPGYGQNTTPGYGQNYAPNYGQNQAPGYGQNYAPNYAPNIGLRAFEGLPPGARPTGYVDEQKNVYYLDGAGNIYYTTPDGEVWATDSTHQNKRKISDGKEEDKKDKATDRPSASATAPSASEEADGRQSGASDTNTTEPTATTTVTRAADPQRDGEVPPLPNDGAYKGLSVTHLDLTTALCQDGWCPGVIGNITVYRDAHHYTNVFARTLAAEIERQMFGRATVR